MPSVSSFDYPSSRFASRMQRQAFITPFAWSYVPSIILNHYNPVRWCVVEGRIQTKMLWLLGRWPRSHHCIVVDQLRQNGPIIYISSSYYYTQRHSSSITQNVIFYARFCAVSRIGAIFFFPPQATSHRFRQPIATPTGLSASCHTSASTVPKFVQRPQPVSIQQIDHRRSARDQTLLAWRATGCQSRGGEACHRATSDHQTEAVRRALVAVMAEAVFRSPPKDHQELVLVLAFQHFIRFLGSQTRS